MYFVSRSRYCRSSTSPIDDAHLVVDLVEELLAHDDDELLVLVIAAGQRLLLQELVDGDVLDQLFHLFEHRQRRHAGVLRVLRGVEEQHLDLARAGAGAPFVVRIGVRLAPDLVDVAEQLFGLLGVKPVGRAAVRVELGLLDRRQLRHHVGQALRILLRQRLAHARQRRPQRRDVGGVRRDVLADARARDLLFVDVPLDLVVEQIGHANQLEPPFERLELGHLFEHRQMRLVRRADEELVEEEDRILHRHFAVLDGAEQIFVGFERPLQEVGVLDDAAVGVDQLARVFEQRQSTAAPAAARPASDPSSAAGRRASTASCGSTVTAALR